MPRESDFFFPSSDGRTRIHAHEWMPDTNHIVGVVQICHGVAEYIQRYAPLARFLTQYGYVVVGNDHLGHGKSINTTADQGYFSDSDGWDNVVNDIRTLKIMSARKFPDVPYFMLGHSMGSFLLRTYLIRFPATVNGAIISGTGQMKPSTIKAGQAVAALEAKRIGARGRSAVIDKLSFGSYNKQFAPNRTPYDWLSVDPENVDNYIADPLCGAPSTVGLFRDMLGGLLYIQDSANLSKMDINTPVFFFSGDRDPVGESTKGVMRAYESFAAAGVQDLSLMLYENGRHEMLNDINCMDVYYDILKWLEARVCAPVAVK